MGLALNDPQRLTTLAVDFHFTVDEQALKQELIALGTSVFFVKYSHRIGHEWLA